MADGPDPLRPESDERARWPVTPEKLKWMWDRSRNTGQVLHGHPWDAALWADLTEIINSLLAALATAEQERDGAIKALDGAISGANDLLDKLLRAEKARAVKVTAKAIHKATGPQAAPEIENAAPGATGEGS